MNEPVLVGKKFALLSLIKSRGFTIFILTVALVLLYPLTFWLPLKWAWKANVLEWVHAFLLASGFFIAFWLGRTSRHPRVACFWYGMMPIWFLMLWRDLNWGKIFFPPVAMTPEGPVFGPLHNLWYGRFVYPAIALILLAWLWAVIYYRLYKVPIWVLRNKVLPVFESVVSAVMIYVMLRAEDGVLLPGSIRGEMLEELAEFVLFLSFIFLNLVLARSLHNYEEPLKKQSDNLTDGVR